MRIHLHKDFKKALAKLPASIQAKALRALAKFELNPFEPMLKNHALSGSMQGWRAMSVTGSYRIVFREIDNYILVIMLDVGTHDDVYE